MKAQPLLHTWQTELALAITDVQALCAELQLDAHRLKDIDTHSPFPLRVPRGFVARMEKGNPKDPLLLQILPIRQEAAHHPNFHQDPLGEKQVNPIPGLLHKYHGRVLLILSGGCAIHCRYCFRRHFPYADNVSGTQQWQPALNYIARNTAIEEVIFSGGDPLIVKDKQLAELVAQLETIPHLKTLRIHTRLPVVIPERINDTFLDWITNTRLKPIVVIHTNHANEIDHTVVHALNKLNAAGITLLNQTVLLKDVNDNVDALINLNQKLFYANVTPYYLHMLDPVEGAAHFDVNEQQAVQLIGQMAERLPGYLVPKLVREIAGAPSKIGIGGSGKNR